MNSSNKNKVEFFCNTLEFAGVIAVLGLACIIQFVAQELPCPLCLLQRIGLFLVAIGLLLNLRFGAKPLHYAMIILSALYTSIVAMRQIALHICTPNSGYGSPFLGFHLYTWTFILSIAIIVFTTVTMTLHNMQLQNKRHSNKVLPIAKILILAAIVLVFINLIVVYLECGLEECPDNPTNYKFRIY